MRILSDFHRNSALFNPRQHRDEARVQIPLSAVLLAILCMFWLNLGSLRALDDRLRHSAGLRRLLSQVGWSGTISDDTFADALQGLELKELRKMLQRQAKRELKGWRCGRYLESELGQRLKTMGAGWLAASGVVAIDGHELFSSRNRCCEQCLTRMITLKQDGEEVAVEEYYHRVVVAQWIGVHPAILLDVEDFHPGENELVAAHRLIKRLEHVYGNSIGILVMDALYDNEPIRSLARRSGFKTVIRHKNENWDPGKTGKRLLDRRDPNRMNPDSQRKEGRNRRYECWRERIPEGERLYVEVRRTITTSKGEHVQRAALLTDLPEAKTPLVALAMLYETRWWIENVTFHEMAGCWSLDRAFAHVDRPTAASAIVILALMAFNAFQVYVYRHLGLEPEKPSRTLGDLRRDFLETLSLPRVTIRARAP